MGKWKTFHYDAIPGEEPRTGILFALTERLKDQDLVEVRYMDGLVTFRGRFHRAMAFWGWVSNCADRGAIDLNEADRAIRYRLRFRYMYAYVAAVLTPLWIICLVQVLRGDPETPALALLILPASILSFVSICRWVSEMRIRSLIRAALKQVGYRIVSS